MFCYLQDVKVINHKATLIKIYDMYQILILSSVTMLYLKLDACKNKCIITDIVLFHNIRRNTFHEGHYFCI